MTWRAGIVSVSTLFVNRLERMLPPDHRIRADRADPVRDLIEMIVTGPMMPLLGDGEEPGHVQLVMEMRTPKDEGMCAEESDDNQWALNARFEVGDFRCHKTLGEWNIARFPDYLSFTRFINDAG